jgi:uracil phosphoribosyltransferase
MLIRRRSAPLSSDDSSDEIMMTPSENDNMSVASSDVMDHSRDFHALRAQQPNYQQRASTKKMRKRSRYLSAKERLDVLSRIERGESQAELARAFGVTRAAICYINKNRHEILSRAEEDPSDEGMGQLELPLFKSERVYELRSPAISILMTALRNQDTQSPQFRMVADRIIRLLLEETLGTLHTRTIEYVTPHGFHHRGPERDQSLCAVSMDRGGTPLVRLLQVLEPHTPTGSISLEENNPMRRRQHGSDQFRLTSLTMPPGIESSHVLLLDALCNNGRRVCETVQTLIRHGANSKNITFVCVLCSVEAIQEIIAHLPSIRVVVAAIEPDVDPHGNLIPGAGNFMERYFYQFLHQPELSYNQEVIV